MSLATSTPDHSSAQPSAQPSAVDHTASDHTTSDHTTSDHTTSDHAADEQLTARGAANPQAAAGQTVQMSPLLDIVAWNDPVLDDRGYDPRSPYVERFWLRLLGPSVTWLLRRFARGLEEHPGGFRINLADTGRALGLGESIARNSTTQRTITRACQFGLAQRVGPDRLSVRTRLPELTRRQLSRLPESVQQAHDRWLDAVEQATRRDHGGSRIGSVLD